MKQNKLDTWVDMVRPMYPEYTDIQLANLRNVCYTQLILGGDTVSPELYEYFLQWRTWCAMNTDYV